MIHPFKIRFPFGHYLITGSIFRSDEQFFYLCEQVIVAEGRIWWMRWMRKQFFLHGALSCLKSTFSSSLLANFSRFLSPNALATANYICYCFSFQDNPWTLYHVHLKIQTWLHWQQSVGFLVALIDFDLCKISTECGCDYVESHGLHMRNRFWVFESSKILYRTTYNIFRASGDDDCRKELQLSL